MTSLNLPEKAIIVTGACGFIGSHVWARLNEAGARVIACDLVPPAQRGTYFAGHGDLEWVDALTLPIWLDRHGVEVGAIVHLGAISSTTETSLVRLNQLNLHYTLDLWRRSCRAGWRFVYASSAATYGNGEHGFVDSDDLGYLFSLAPLNPYGASKARADLDIVADAQAGRYPPCWAGLKFFNVYGPHEEHKGAMRSLVRKIVPQILRGEPVELFRSHRPDFADGQQRRDFIHVDDAVAAVLAALQRPQFGGLFNVGSGLARSFEDLALATYRALGCEPQIEFIDMPEGLRGHYQYHTEARIEKALGCGLMRAPLSLETGVANYVAKLDLEVLAGEGCDG